MKLSGLENNPEDKNIMLKMAIKCSDIGHSAKPLNMHIKWSNFVCEEFFKQGDQERELNLPISMYCDR